MVQYANINPAAPTDGVPYALNMAVPAAEGDLFNGQPLDYDPVPIPYEQAVLAVVQLNLPAPVGSNVTYIVMQFDLGDGVWVDAAWLTWTSLSGSATFVLCNGAFANNSFQQTRAVGNAPSPPSGSNAMPVGGRMRFVGKSTTTAISSSSSAKAASPSPSSAVSVVQQLTVTIRYRLLGLR